MKKERHPIDEFFREALDDFQISPSEEVRKVFLEDAKSIQKNSSIKNWWSLLLPLILIIVTIGLFTYFDIVQATGKEKQENSTQQSIINIKNGIEGNESEHEGIESDLNKMKVSNKLTKFQESNSEKIQQKIVYEKKSNEVPSKDLHRSLPNSSMKEDTITYPVSSLQPLSNLDLEEIVPEISDTLIQTTYPSIIRDTSNKVGQIKATVSVVSLVKREWRLSTGLYFSPEWMFHTLENTKFVTNFGLEGMFRFGNYSIRTGAGISITKGTNQLLVEYNDYLGSYMKLDSMTFAWDAKHYYLVPTYYLSNKNVYDSLMKLDDSKIIKRYTYLQIPIILGYDFIQKEKMSFGLRVGPIMSILLGEKTLSGAYDPGKKQIISINEITPEQVNLNWQIMVGLNATFRLSSNLGIEIEPFGKYYFNSVHETSSGTGKPWSIGLRAAFFISFP